MEPVRPLRDVFAELADQAAGPEDAGSSLPDSRSLLAEYDDLPDDLLVTAIGSYAGTAPAEVAEHLAEFVATPGADLANGLDLLATAPAGSWEGEVSLADPDPDPDSDLDAYLDSNPDPDGADVGSLNGLTGVDGSDGVDGVDGSDGVDGVDGSDGFEDVDDAGDGDPGLHLDDLDSADSLDQTVTSRFEEHTTSNDLDDTTPDDDTDDETDADDLAGQPTIGSAFSADDLTEVNTGINDDTGINDVDDVVVDPTDADQANLPADGPDPADGHDYLEHQITGHGLDNQQADLDDLNDVQDFDEFDA